MELNSQNVPRDVLVIGASAGGLEPTLALLSSLPIELPAVVGVVIHRGAFGGPSLLADVVSRLAGRAVIEPLEPVTALPGVIYLGPRDQHIVFDRGRILAVRSAKQHFTRPAADPLFVSAAEGFGRRVVGVLLSGGGSDGVYGMIQIKRLGGMSLVQRPDEAPHPSMPARALEEDHVDAALPLSDLMRVIPELVRGQRVTTNGLASGNKGWLPPAGSKPDEHDSR